VKINGHGGYWVVKSSDDVNVIVHNAEYELELELDAEEANTPDAANWAEGLPKIKRVRSLRMTVAEDDALYPEILGLALGKVTDVWLKRGALAGYDLIQNAEVVRYGKVNDQQKARRVRVELERGQYSHNVSAPTLP
jgi:hypothetical protein